MRNGISGLKKKNRCILFSQSHNFTYHKESEESGRALPSVHRFLFLSSPLFDTLLSELVEIYMISYERPGIPG